MSKHVKALRHQAAYCREKSCMDCAQDDKVMDAAADALEIAERENQKLRKALKQRCPQCFKIAQIEMRAEAAIDAGRKVRRRAGAPKPGAGKIQSGKVKP
jgi:hypothetical protein